MNNAVAQLNFIESNAKGLKRTLSEVGSLDLGSVDVSGGEGGKVGDAVVNPIRKAYEDLSAWLTDYNRSAQAKIEALYRERKAIIDTALKQELVTAQE